MLLPAADEQVEFLAEHADERRAGAAHLVRRSPARRGRGAR
jgi:hypothetical protein